MDLFGDSDSEDENVSVGPSQETLKLIAEKQKSTEKVEEEREVHFPTPIPLPALWPEPLFQGPVVFNDDSEEFGGGRSFVAQVDLPPGTLLMKELPLSTWPSEAIGKALSVDVLKSVPDLGLLDNLFPYKLSDVPASVVEERRLSMDAELKHLSSEISVPADDLLRYYFTLTCNGFDSGVYGHLSIFNHSELPNCIKFSPTDGVPYSEVRTVKHVKKGDHLTISYMNPREQSFARRRKYFLDQHNFDIADEIRGLSTVQKFDSTTRSAEEVENTEKTIDEFTKMYEEFKAVNDEAGKASVEFASEIKEKLSLKCRDLYAASLQLLSTVLSMFPSHVILLRCLRLHTNLCALMLDLASTSTDIVLIDEMEGINILCDFVENTGKLLELQVSYHEGETHPDVGATVLDLAEGINGMLGKAPGRLFDLEIFRLESIVASSKYESELRATHRRIEKMFK